MTRKNVVPRRTALQLGAAALVVPSWARAATRSMVVVDAGGALEDAYRKAIYEPWAQKTGIEIVTGPDPTANLKSMVDAGVMDWDVAQLDSVEAAAAARQGLLEPLDYDIIDKNDIIPGMAHEYYISSDLAATCLSWNTDRLNGGPAPSTWVQAWNLKQYVGQRGILRTAPQTLEIALMADGVDKDHLYPLDVARGLRSLDKIKNQILWWDNGAQGAQILIDGDVVISMEWEGRVKRPRDLGAKVDFTLNQALYGADAWAVPKGVKNKKLSMEFVAFALAGPQQLAYSRLLPYGPVSLKAISMMNKTEFTKSPSNPAVRREGVVMNFDWWAENNEKISEQFNRWLIAG
jgi:putative spermidine/putrescine transport system substrate-binding protein